jgi:hypothetical protein
LRHEENQADGDSVADDDEGETFEQMLMSVAHEMRQESPFEKLLPYLENFEGKSNPLEFTADLKAAFAACKLAREEGAADRVVRATAEALLIGVWTFVKCDRHLQRGCPSNLDQPSMSPDFTTLPRRMEMKNIRDSAIWEPDHNIIHRTAKALLHLHKFYLVADKAIPESEVFVSAGGARRADPEVREYFNAKEIMA